MRLWLSLLCLLFAAACTGPHSDGGLWSLRNQIQEGQLFRLSDTQRAEQVQATEDVVADQAISDERSRLNDAAAACPGPREPLAVSSGDRIRDGVRLRVANDPGRLHAVARLALADWYLRRAAATGDARMCADARDPLPAGAEGAHSNLLDSIPPATVTRDPRISSVPLATDAPGVSLSLYALGYVDAIHAAAPLPYYLAAVYGGSLVSPSARADPERAAGLVDVNAAAYPEWEPDALYAALGGFGAG